MPTTYEVGKKLVDLCKAGKHLEASPGFCFPDNLVGKLSAPDLG